MRTDLGDGIHKVRVAISSKNKGKSGGAAGVGTPYIVLISCFVNPALTSSKMSVAVILNIYTSLSSFFPEPLFG